MTESEEEEKGVLQREAKLEGEKKRIKKKEKRKNLEQQKQQSVLTEAYTPFPLQIEKKEFFFQVVNHPD